MTCRICSKTSSLESVIGNRYCKLHRKEVVRDNQTNCLNTEFSPTTHRLCPDTCCRTLPIISLSTSYCDDCKARRLEKSRKIQRTVAII